jgi:hypothetical protein
MKISPVGAAVFHSDGQTYRQTDRQTDRQTNMTKVTVALRNSANVSKTTYIYRRLQIAEFISASFCQKCNVLVCVCACVLVRACLYINIACAHTNWSFMYDLKPNLLLHMFLLLNNNSCYNRCFIDCEELT